MSPAQPSGPMIQVKPGMSVNRAEAVRRLNRLVLRTETCWLWTGYLKNGYGCTEFRGVPVYTHQLSYALRKGSLKSRDNVLHKCDVRNCVRPKHLFRGTKLDNVLDMWKKGRAVAPPRITGERHHLTTLRNSDVIEIKRLGLAGISGQRTIAKKFKVSQSTVWRIINRKVWRHLGS